MENSDDLHLTFWLIWVGTLVFAGLCLRIIRKPRNASWLSLFASIGLTIIVCYLLIGVNWISSGVAVDQPMTVFGMVFVGPVIASVYSCFVWAVLCVIWPLPIGTGAVRDEAGEASS